MPPKFSSNHLEIMENKMKRVKFDLNLLQKVTQKFKEETWRLCNDFPKIFNYLFQQMQHVNDPKISQVR